MTEFGIFVSKSDFKFNCAHFIAIQGLRERLHGHNYRLSVQVFGSELIGEDGYVIDFGDIKKVTRELCKALNEYFICPMKSKEMIIQQIDKQICLECIQDGAKFSFPVSDCAMLPLYHSSAEELAHYFWCEIVRKIGLETLNKRMINAIQISVAEAPQQLALFKSKIPKTEEELIQIQNRVIRFKPTLCFENDSDVLTDS